MNEGSCFPCRDLNGCHACPESSSVSNVNMNVAESGAAADASD